MATEKSKKRTLDAFFKAPEPKKPRISVDAPSSGHQTYPFPVPHLPQDITDILGFAPETEAQILNDQPDLDLLYFHPYIPKAISKELFQFLRSELFFYRVKYTIKRFGADTLINTPRYTTVFGIDETSKFAEDGSIVDAQSGKPVPANKYKCKPRPIPQCLDYLRTITEGTTGDKFNFCLVNYYATGDDSISYHSDDERFLGEDPSIASFSLGMSRDFLMKHKPPPKEAPPAKDKESKPIKFSLDSGDMVLMRGKTQSNWLHSVPKRKGIAVGKGRINITFRRALVKGGTENYYQYNVGTGPVYKWDSQGEEMVLQHSMT
jgi:alkylated DNA repair dioxygenase AlkB